jgi:16S rRNA (cytidine1402-2'-O)-methyltransferase
MLYIVATPIGNLDDMSPRAVQVLRKADVIACEDTRRTRALLSHFDIPRPATLLSYREGNERSAGRRLAGFLRDGLRVALCSDSGYPGISDPGYRLTRLAIEKGFDVQVVPGASAVVPALVASGLPTSSYTFKGYAPRKPGAARRFFEAEQDMPHTLVVFESPFRVAKTLQAAYDGLGNRQAAVCIELTKKFERIARGCLEELVLQFADKPIKGEVTIVIAGNNPKFRQAPAAERGGRQEAGQYERNADADGVRRPGRGSPRPDKR